MLTRSCDYVRNELSAYHDEELSVTDRIAIATHLESCPSCAVEANDFALMRDALQASGRSEEASWVPWLGRLQSDIVERLSAEDNASTGRRFMALFDDPRRASASAGVAVVASVLMAVCAFVMARGPVGHPDSLRSVINGARSFDIVLPYEGPVELPRADAEAVMPAAVMNLDGGDDSVSAFAALVTSDGHLTDVELLGGQSYGRHVVPATHEQLSALLNAAATARFEPARLAGSPVSLNVVWLVTHRTVRPTLHARVAVHIDGFRL